jgi:hypothetical protein
MYTRSPFDFKLIHNIIYTQYYLYGEQGTLILDKYDLVEILYLKQQSY